jgi:parallel beta-helix repeat protein/predicted outer membrane repeat protein
MKRTGLIIAGLLITGALVVQGTVKIVGDPTPDYVQITNALANAGDNDVIRCSTGLYVEVINIIGQHVTIDGNYDTGCVSKVAGGTYIRLPAPGVGISVVWITNSIVDLIDLDIAFGQPAGGSFPLNGGGIKIEGSSKVYLDGCHIRQNRANGYGGGIYVHGSILMLTNSLVYSNNAWTGMSGFAGCGGGIAAIDSVVDVYGAGGVGNECLFEYNRADEKGGAIYLADSQCAVTRETADIRFNEATNGGGIAVVDGSALTVSEGADIAGNRAYNAGGGIYLAGSSTGTVTGGQTYIGYNSFALGANVADNNGTGGYGGGIAVYDSILNVESFARVAHNRANRGGGGIYLSNAVCRMDNASVGYPHNTLHTNEASFGGGIDAVYNSQLTLSTNALVKGNIAKDFYGGGIYLYLADLRMDNATVRDNVAMGDHAGGIYLSRSSITGRQSAVNNNRCLQDHGGGIYGYRSMGLLDAVVVGTNWVAGDGGGIAWEGFPADVLVLTNDCQIRRNYAGQNGGGMYVEGPVNMYGGDFYLNQATNHGGGMYLTGAHARVYMSGTDMEHNEADADEDNSGDGGAIWMGGGSFLEMDSRPNLALSAILILTSVVHC